MNEGTTFVVGGSGTRAWLASTRRARLWRRVVRTISWSRDRWARRDGDLDSLRRQEIVRDWVGRGTMVRLEIAAVTKEEKIEPTCISFVESLRSIRSEWDGLTVTSPGAIPKRLATLRRNVKRYILASTLKTQLSTRYQAQIQPPQLEQRRSEGA